MVLLWIGHALIFKTHRPATCPWIQRPATCPWIHRPATWPWIHRPAICPWIHRTATCPWIQRPATCPLIQRSATYPWLQRPATCSWINNFEKNLIRIMSFSRKLFSTPGPRCRGSPGVCKPQRGRGRPWGLPWGQSTQEQDNKEVFIPKREEPKWNAWK